MHRSAGLTCDTVCWSPLCSVETWQCLWVILTYSTYHTATTRNRITVSQGSKVVEPRQHPLNQDSIRWTTTASIEPRRHPLNQTASIEPFKAWSLTQDDIFIKSQASEISLTLFLFTRTRTNVSDTVIGSVTGSRRVGGFLLEVVRDES